MSKSAVFGSFHMVLMVHDGLGVATTPGLLAQVLVSRA